MNNKKIVLAWILISVFLATFLYGVREILFPFIAAAILSYFLHPLTSYFKINKNITTVFIIVCFYVFIVALATFILPAIYNQLVGMAGKIPEYKKLIQTKFIPIIIKTVKNIDPDLVLKITNISNDLVNKFFRHVLDFLTNLLISGGAFVHILSLLVITPILTFYMMNRYDMILKNVYDYIPIHLKKVFSNIFKQIDNTLSGYIRGQTNVCLLMAVYYGALLSIVGLDFSLLIGFLSGLFVFVPFLGILFALSVAIITAVFQFGDIVHLSLIALIYVFGILIEGNILSPKLVGDKIGLGPVLMIFSTMAGGTLLGITGAIFAIPLAGIIGVIIRFLLAQYKNSYLYK